MSHDILLADDDPRLLSILGTALREEGWQTIIESSRADTMNRLRSGDVPAILILSTRIEKLGTDVRQQFPAIKVITLTERDQLAGANRSREAGSLDAIPREPLDLGRLFTACRSAFAEAPPRPPTPEIGKSVNLPICDDGDLGMIGGSSSMLVVRELVRRVAPYNSPVLIMGETGTGKELVAAALHKLSARSRKTFVALNCAAMPEHLLESELFGHVKGAFTGAYIDKVGLFEHAEGGTVFLDEIQHMPLQLQSKLLRFLQDKKVRRVGGVTEKSVDVRVVAALNEDVEECLTSRRLRPDLYYRLGVFPILVPPLRSRSEDVEALALHFAKAKAKLFDLVAPDVSAAALLAMVRYRWPGNVRELEHAIERAVALCDREIGCEHLGLKIVDPATTITRAEDPTTETMKTYVKRVSMDYGLRILAICGGDRRRAAKVLGISMAKFYRVLPAPKRAVAAS